MFRFVSCLSSLIFSAIFATTSPAGLVYEASYSYSQTGNTNFGNSMGPAPQNLVNQQETTDISTLIFNVLTVPTTPTQLKASAGFSINIDQRNSSVTWNTLTATAQAKSSLIETAFVEGIPGVPGGTINVTWAVNGTSDIDVDPLVGGLFAHDATTYALVSSSVPSDAPNLFLNDQADNFTPISDSNPIDSHLAYSTGFQSFVVDWLANQPINLIYELIVTSTINTQNADAAGYNATFNADFSNTATLHSVQVFDGSGTLMENASVVVHDPVNGNYVFEPTVVPEPSAWLMLMGPTLIVGVVRFCLRSCA